MTPHLTPLQRRIMSALMSGRWVATSYLIEYLYGDHPSDEPDSAVAVVRVNVHSMRKRLGANGIEIVSLRGSGYRLSEDSLNIARDLFGYRACAFCGVKADDRPVC